MSSTAIPVAVIGMGAGSTEHLTVGAARALKDCCAILYFDKGEAKADLVAVREAIVAEHAPGMRMIAIPDPARDRLPADYKSEVVSWHEARADLVAEVINQLDTGGNPVGFLVWGDPSLYDSTLRVLDHVTCRSGLHLDVMVYPGITAIQALTAAHKITINRVGEPIHITTVRMLKDTDRELLTNCVVMLDSGDGWNLIPEDLKATTTMYWGAYLGTDKQVLAHGTVAEIGPLLAERKAALRAEHGWIMDTYLLRSKK